MEANIVVSSRIKIDELLNRYVGTIQDNANNSDLHAAKISALEALDNLFLLLQNSLHLEAFDILRRLISLNEQTSDDALIARASELQDQLVDLIELLPTHSALFGNKMVLIEQCLRDARIFNPRGVDSFFSLFSRTTSRSGRLEKIRERVPKDTALTLRVYDADFDTIAQNFLLSEQSNMVRSAIQRYIHTPIFMTSETGHLLLLNILSQVLVKHLENSDVRSLMLTCNTFNALYAKFLENAKFAKLINHNRYLMPTLFFRWMTPHSSLANSVLAPREKLPLYVAGVQRKYYTFWGFVSALGFAKIEEKTRVCQLYYYMLSNEELQDIQEYQHLPPEARADSEGFEMTMAERFLRDNISIHPNLLFEQTPENQRSVFQWLAVDGDTHLLLSLLKPYAGDEEQLTLALRAISQDQHLLPKERFIKRRTAIFDHLEPSYQHLVTEQLRAVIDNKLIDFEEIYHDFAKATAHLDPRTVIPSFTDDQEEVLQKAWLAISYWLRTCPNHIKAELCLPTRREDNDSEFLAVHLPRRFMATIWNWTRGALTRSEGNLYDRHFADLGYSLAFSRGVSDRAWVGPPASSMAFGPGKVAYDARLILRVLRWKYEEIKELAECQVLSSTLRAMRFE